MKRYAVPMLISILAVVLLLAGCASPTVPTYDTKLGGGQGAETTALNGGTSLLKSAVSATGLTITGSGIAVVNAAAQKLYVDFNYVVDSSSIASGIFLYPLSSAADNFTPYLRGTAIPFTSDVQLTAAGSRVIFTADFTSAPTSVEFFIDATKLTAKSGTQKLDSNANGIQGEDNDSVTQTITVGTAPGGTAPAAAPATGAARNPTATLSVTTPTSLLSASQVLTAASYGTAPNLLTFFVQDTGSSATRDKISVANAATVFKNVDGVWTAVTTATIAYATGTNTATITLPTAPAKGDSYKVVIDLYNVVESAAVLGYTHRASYAQANVAARYITRYFNFTNTGGIQQAVTTAVGGSAFNRFVDVTIAGSPIDLTTLTANSFKVRLVAGTGLATGTALGEFLTPYSIVTTQTGTFDSKANAVFGFRVYLPATIQNLAAGNRIELAPSILSLPHTVTTGLDTRSFGNIAGSDGWQTVTF